MKGIRSAILILGTLSNMELQESTKERVLSIIVDTKKKYGEEAAEKVADRLIQMVEASRTEAELLQKLDQMI